MDNITEKMPPRWVTEALERSEAQIDTGQTVPLEPVLDRLRLSIARMKAGKMRADRKPVPKGDRPKPEAEAQVDQLIAHSEAKQRLAAAVNLLDALERAKRHIAQTPEAGLEAPRPYPVLKRLGRRWIIEGRYWIPQPSGRARGEPCSSTATRTNSDAVTRVRSP